jgi:hypothetical protein
MGTKIKRGVGRRNLMTAGENGMSRACGRSEKCKGKLCDFTHKIATAGSISLPLFTRNQSPKLNDVSIEWKDKFAVSKFWKHNIAEKIFGLCSQNEPHKPLRGGFFESRS